MIIDIHMQILFAFMYYLSSIWIPILIYGHEMYVSLGLTSDYMLGHFYCTQYKSDVHFANLREYYTKNKDMNASNRFSKIKDKEPGSFYSPLG